MRAGQGMATGGTALSDAYGPSLGRGMGEQTGLDRAVGNMTIMPGIRSSDGGSGHAGHGGMSMEAARRVPGYPQGMMDMPVHMTEAQLRKLNKGETRGMRRDWYAGVEGLMTVVRVLPPDLYERVMSGEGEVEPGASTPGGGAGESTPHRHRN
jgi:hypothetical protein